MKKSELFKDYELFLRLNLKTVRLNNFKDKLIENGWIIKEEQTDNGINVKFYESEYDLDWDNYLYQDNDTTSNKAFKKCITVIRDYYKRIQENDK